MVRSDRGSGVPFDRPGLDGPRLLLDTKNVHPGQPAIEDYALIGDCRSAALVSNHGSIDWLCWPRFDSPAIFAAILDPEKGGSFRIKPRGEFRATRHYEPASNVLVTDFETESGSLRLTDLFFATSEERKKGRFLPNAMIIRRAECTAGEVEIEIFVRPTVDFAAKEPKLERRGPGSWLFSIGDGVVHLASDAALEKATVGLEANLQLKEGLATNLILALNPMEPAVYPPLGESAQLIEETNQYWRTWIECITYVGKEREAVIRSSLALKLMTYAPSGAVVAAPTTSLPERIGAPYNWDYRFCWIRDASDTIEALLGLGMDEEAGAFLQWLLHATRLTQPRLRIMYDVLGNPAPAESELGHLSGYRGSAPVRIGNAAHSQLQLDVYGEVVRAAAISCDREVRLSGDEKALLQGIAKYVMANWDKPDSGIWETRGPPRHFVHSKLMCWVALDRIVAMVEAGHLQFDAEILRDSARKIAAAIRERGFNSNLGSYVSAFDGDELDSAVLTLAIFGFEEANSPTMASTIAVVQRELSNDGLVFRHQNQETGGEGAFLLCSFWLVQCLALQGKIEEASDLFNSLCERANDVGLYAEEVDPKTGEFLGNFPQAFTHIGLINAALAIDHAKAATEVR